MGRLITRIVITAFAASLAISLEVSCAHGKSKGKGSPTTAQAMAKAKAAGVETFGFTSPGSVVHMDLIVEHGQLFYIVSREGGGAVIEKSPLVFTVDRVNLADGIIKSSEQTRFHRDTYATRGVHSTATDRYNDTKMSLRHASGTEYTLELRLFDDGVGYRFIVAGDAKQSRVPDERSEFILPAGTTAWSHNLRGHYEGDYTKHDISEYKKGDWAAPPTPFKLPRDGGYASITESALVNYSGMALESDGQRGFIVGLAHRQPVSYPYELRYPAEDVERLSHPAKVSGTITTPWRVILVAKDLNTLVNSDIVNNLAPPPDRKFFPKGIDTDWVKPGRAVWQYLDRGEDTPRRRATSMTTTRPATTRAASTRDERREGLVGDIFPTRTSAATRQSQFPPREGSTSTDDVKRFSKLAGELGFEYQIIEGFWRRWGTDELKDVIDYSRQQGVSLFVWVHSKWLHDPAVRKALFTKCHQYGIAGLKIDFFDHEHKETIDLYQAILRECAENKLLLIFHGANKPAGEERTWPNEMNREAIHGMEASRQPDRAFHETVLPFTRFLAGHGDYTPMLFTDRRGNVTWAHEVAIPVVFDETIITYGANPRHILDNPAVDMIKSIPPTWDQTIVLPQSSIGEVAVYARRKGETWFLAVLNGNGARKFEVPLSFLGGGKYRTMTVADDNKTGDSASMQIDRDKRVDRNDSFSIDMQSGGGFVARFDKEGSK
jgi:alpha-glucosidase